ncbi:uncharacterized protein [Prorops nasuta]|uniref:uncharacterized protein n=1 Tax=Prorops nasuta TaxID=863751 RepID=UPI0034CE4E06
MELNEEGSDIEEIIPVLYNDQKWEEILELKVDYLKTYKFFWVLPTLNDLYWLQNIITSYKMQGIMSVGCGCGLFEWLFYKSTGTTVIGVELDELWWCSRYAPLRFLEDILFLEENDINNFKVPKKYALFFCYFNNKDAFCTYINNYKGQLVIVIGPNAEKDRTADPLPFDDKFTQFGWELFKWRRMITSQDYIAVYRKICFV